MKLTGKFLRKKEFIENEITMNYVIYEQIAAEKKAKQLEKNKKSNHKTQKEKGLRELTDLL